MPVAPDRPFTTETLNKERQQRAEQAERDARPYLNHPTVTVGEFKRMSYAQQQCVNFELRQYQERVKVECATGQPYYVTKAKEPAPEPVVNLWGPPLVLTPYTATSTPTTRPRLRITRRLHRPRLIANQYYLPFYETLS